MIALDTNILIYACDESSAKRQETALETIASSTDGVLLWQVAVEFIAASRKLSAQGFTSADAWDRLTEFLDIFPLILPTPGVLARAKELHMTQGRSFWDATVVAACVDAGVTTLYSEDLPGRRDTPIEIVNPFTG